jgi:hypothetical protein
MRPNSLPLILLALGLLSACSTPASRIAENQAAFAQYPAEVQQKIRAGKIDLGYTQEMVRLALGEPSRQLTQQTEAGQVELWMYRDNSPHFSIGVGMGTSDYHGGGHHSGSYTGVGGGVAVSTGDYYPEEKMRVEFRGGRVSAYEYAKK